MARSSWKFCPTNRTFVRLLYEITFYKKLLILKKYNDQSVDNLDYKIKLIRAKFSKRLKFFSRQLIIPEIFTRVPLQIHKGNFFSKLFINKFVLGRRLGEFSFTRKPFKYPIRKKKKNFIRR